MYEAVPWRLMEREEEKVMRCPIREGVVMVMMVMVLVLMSLTW